MRGRFNGPIYNAYGVTETTVYNIIAEFTNNSTFENALREVLPGTRAYVLNAALQPVPLDAVGELYLAGDCVTRGYLNQPLLTDQRFIPNSFCSDEDVAAGRFAALQDRRPGSIPVQPSAAAAAGIPRKRRSADQDEGIPD